MPAPQQAQCGGTQFIYTNMLGSPSCPSLEPPWVWLTPRTGSCPWLLSLLLSAGLRAASSLAVCSPGQAVFSPHTASPLRPGFISAACPADLGSTGEPRPEEAAEAGAHVCKRDTLLELTASVLPAAGAAVPLPRTRCCSRAHPPKRR